MQKTFFSLSLILIPLLLQAEEYVSGVSTEAISMPSFSGTVEGVPQTINESGSKGNFSFNIEIKTPKGVNNHNPKVVVEYSSLAGQSEFGLGWSFNIPSIYLSTKQGVPTYTETDQFWGPDGELVRIERGAENLFFTPYINRVQNLYEYNEGEKKWTLHQADGKKLYFGDFSSSKIENNEKTSRWFVEKISDPQGNFITFHYEKYSGYPYIKRIDYAYKNETPHYHIDFVYEDREDLIESYKSTFKTVISKRCKEINVTSGASHHVIRSYEFLYESQAYTKGSVLKQVKQHGEGKADLIPPMPPVEFTYSDINLENEFKSQRLEFEDSEAFPPSLNKGRATFVDINRDSFPDVIETSRKGAKVWINNRVGGFSSHYLIPEFISVLGEEQTKLLDVDGDRVVDFVATGLYPKYFKGGVSTSVGELGFSNNPTSITSIPKYTLGSDNVKTIDINADGRLDILAREVDGFYTFISTSSGNWNKAQEYRVNTGAFDLSSRYTFFSDMNGDGLVDLVFVRPNSVVYLPNTGTGIFANPVVMQFVESNPLILNLFKIGKYNFVSDINGDGFDDLINVTESVVSISINQGDGSFGETIRFENIHEDEFDLKGLHITMADINGNSSQDIVWTNDFHDWRYLDFKNTPSNLITKIDNGLGLKTHIEYGYATEFFDKSGVLSTNLPQSTVIVKTIKESLGNSSDFIRHEEYSYFGGYYHALDNDFRGFNLVEKIEYGDSSIESLFSTFFYEQGRLTSKDHQQLMLLKKSDYEYSSDKAVGHLLKEEDYDLTSLPTLTSLEAKFPAIPYASRTTITEGDFDPSTPDRKHKIEREFILSADGFIEKNTILTYLDLVQLVRKEEQRLAITNTDNSHILNRVCEKNIYDSANNLLASDRFYYDGSSSLCYLTSGQTSKKDVWNGASYETKGQYTYTTFGGLLTFSDSFNHITTIGYDSLDINPTSVTNPALHVKSAGYDSANGMMSSITDENGLQTNFAYDLYLRMVKIAGPADSLALPTQEAIYSFGTSSGDLNSILIKKREKSGQVGTFDIKEFFDGKARSLFKITEGQPNRFVLEGTSYNNRGEKHLVYQKSFKNGFSIPETMDGIHYFETKYDSLKRPILIFNPEHTGSETSYKEYFYLVGETVLYDEERKESHEYKDALGRRIGHKDALNNQVTYEFDSLDLMTKIIDPQSSETIFGYDSQKRRICKVDPTVGLTTYSYNTESLVTEKLNYGFVAGHTSCSAPVGVTPRMITYDYNDNLNRMTKIDFPAGSNTEDVIYNYDEITSTYPKGKLTSVNLGFGSKKFDFDIYGNQSKTTLTIGLASYETEKKYDVLGRVEKIIYPTIGANSLSIKYNFDDGSLLSSVQDNLTSFYYAQNMLYSPLGQMAVADFGNNTKTTMSYNEIDQSYRLTNILTEKMGTPNTTIQNINYEYDKVSNIIERNDLQNSFAENYLFDDLHRLTNADLGEIQKSWSFDEIGNITSNNGVEYSYNSSRKQIISSVGASSYIFDIHGNISQDDSRIYVFDWNNRLRSVTKSSQTTTYDYGEDGIRLIKTTPSERTVFIDKYTELRGSNVVRHIYANNKQIASIDELNSITYNHPDHLGSSNLKTDSLGTVVKRIEYVPFGNKRAEVGSYNNIKNRFTGQYDDEESDLYYYQQRYYDPVLSRFISADPLYSEEMDKRGVNSQELNLYSYVKNNPINFTDPNGLLGLKFTTSIGADVGLGRSYSFGVAVAWNKEGNMSLAFTSGKETSLGAQVGVGGDVIKVGVSNAEHVKDMGGLGAGVSGGVAEFKWGLGGSVGYEQGSNDQGKTIKEFSLGLSYGWGAGIGKISASEGEIGIIKDETVKPEPLYQHQTDQATQDTNRSDSSMDFGN